MANQEFFRQVFDQLATDGCIGDPGGAVAYCYLRVSSSEQAEEGRSGLPRQILHVHEAAAMHGYKIPWESVFADDHTGFQFRDRPALSRLREEYKAAGCRADVVIIENIDRLSRNADWHQGFLLEEMRNYGISVLFWKSFSSRIERAVMGAISQEGMEQAIQRMREGNIFKAQSGRVTARTRAYGFIFVDAEGNPSAATSKETYYAHHPDEAEVIKLIFQKIGLEGMATRSLANYLEERYPPPGRYTHWEPRQIVLFIRNPVYKGEFVAQRFKEVLVPSQRRRAHEPAKLVTKKVERPRDEWIIVPVPPIVDEQLWNLANRALERNKMTASRNGKLPFLLTGLLKCAECGYSYVGGSKTYRRKDGKTVSRYYRCSTRSNRINAVRDEIGCHQKQVQASMLEEAVWSSISSALLQPDLLLARLNEQVAEAEDQGTNQTIERLRQAISRLDDEDERLYRAYMADVFDEFEFADRRLALKEKRQGLQVELNYVESKQVSRQDVERKRSLVMAFAKQLIDSGATMDAPFEIKQRILQLLVDEIKVNQEEGWAEIEGVIPTTVDSDEHIVSTPMDTGSSRQSGRNWPGR